jgi:uncharacterized protein YoxC
MADVDSINTSQREIGINYNHAPPEAIDVKKEKVVEEGSTVKSAKPIDINELIKDPRYKALLDQVAANYENKSDEEKFSIQRVIMSLIDLSQALQGAATALADRLSRITERMNAYAKKMSQVPVLGDEIPFENSEKRANANQRFGVMLESIRAYKGIEEDAAKKVQTILQTIKDAGTSASDFVSSFLDVIRGISQKITQ